MVDFLNVALPILLYAVGIIALVVLIILGIRMIKVIDKVEKLVDNVEGKVNSLNVAFSLIDKTTDSLVNIGNTVVGAVNSIVSKVFNKSKTDDEEDIYE